VRLANRGANGALVARGGLRRGRSRLPRWRTWAAFSAGLSRGGKIVQGTLPVPGMVWSAYVLEPEGNTIGCSSRARPLARQIARYLLAGHSTSRKVDGMSMRRIRRRVNSGAMLTAAMPRSSAATMLPPVSAAVTPSSGMTAGMVALTSQLSRA